MRGPIVCQYANKDTDEFHGFFTLPSYFLCCQFSTLQNIQGMLGVCLEVIAAEPPFSQLRSCSFLGGDRGGGGWFSPSFQKVGQSNKGVRYTQSEVYLKSIMSQEWCN